MYYSPLTCVMNDAHQHKNFLDNLMDENGGAWLYANVLSTSSRRWLSGGAVSEEG